MYVVSEITGKRYATVDECVADEKEYNRARKEKNKMRLNKAWDDMIAAMDTFANIAEEVDEDSGAELKALLEIIKS